MHAGLEGLNGLDTRPYIEAAGVEDDIDATNRKLLGLSLDVRLLGHSLAWPKSEAP